MVKYEIPIIVDSDTASGALNKIADGSSFEINLSDAIAIPKNSKTCTVQVQEATVWWVIPNILSSGGSQNNLFSIDDGVNPSFDVAVPQGLYDLNTLQVSIDSAVVADGGASGLFTLIGDSATQKVIIRINGIGISIDFTIANSFRDILGFNSQVLGPTLVVQTDFLANNQAQFNTLDYFLIHSDIVSQGMRTNNTFSQTIAQVLIDQAPGSQIVSKPFNPPKVPASELIGSKRKLIRFWLTNQSNEVVNTNGENWSARIIIEYNV